MLMRMSNVLPAVGVKPLIVLMLSVVDARTGTLELLKVTWLEAGPVARSALNLPLLVKPPCNVRSPTPLSPP